jgi:lactate dehydrogenase-like 2-hydroxyacid dehydrogenase
MKPVLLVKIAVSSADRAQIGKSYEVLYVPQPDQLAAMVAQRGADIHAVLTNGTTGMSAAQMAELPKLALVCALGVGYENIDVAAARARGVAVANGAGTNAACVADHAMALLLATVRTIPALDKFTRTGQWRESIGLTPGFSGKKLGLLGLGQIAQQIARRGAGFDLKIGYHSRTRHDIYGFDYFESAVALAEWADFIVVATPGGAATHHMVNAAVLAALGPRGYLVNIARGSVVDTAALADALRRGALGGAGLDVYESEPEPPRELFDFPNVVLTPHVGGRSPEAIEATIERFLENAGNHFAGKPMVSPL